MQRVVWSCDGCGSEREVRNNPYTRLRVRVETAHPGTVLPEHADMPNKVVESLYCGDVVDLCLTCKAKLLSRVNIKQWKKPDAAIE